jgi:DNA-binding transcriptional MocR family regulator
MNRSISADRAAALLGRAAERSPAYLGIADGLRLLISDGRIPPGTRLPSERELTGALGVSRTTVTRAYAHLRDLGYLSSRQGSGSVTRLPAGRAGGVRDMLLNPEPGEPDSIDLTCAAPMAPFGITAAYSAAVAELPCHLPESGYYPSGLPALRESIARRYAERGLPTEPEQLLVTSGALSALAVVVRAFVDAGDRVLTESPSYPNAIATLRSARARVSGAHIDQSGWATSSLVDAVGQLRPASAYLMPDFHNPTGLLMDDDQRDRLAAALRRSRTLPIVDETMAEMAIDPIGAPAPLPFAVHAPDTISVGSASKAFWAGLRIGWVRVSDARLAELVAARLTLDLGAPVVEQLALLHLMEQRETVLGLRRRQLAESRAALVGALASRLPSWRYRVPAGGLSLWCELPRPLSSALAQAAPKEGVLVAAGPLFAPEGGLERFVRLPFTRPADELVLAVDRLASAWETVTEERRPARRRTRDRAPALVT